jgi:hypothetical protein
MNWRDSFVSNRWTDMTWRDSFISHSFFKYLLKNQNKKIPCHPPAPLSSHLLQSSFPLLSLERETPRVRKRPCAGEGGVVAKTWRGWRRCGAPTPRPPTSSRGRRTRAPPLRRQRADPARYDFPIPRSHGCLCSSTPSLSLGRAQPSEAIKKVVFGGQVTEEEADSFSNRWAGRFPRVLVLSPQIWTGRSTDLTSARLFRKQCSAPKWKEMTGSGIFAAGSNGEDGSAAAKPARAAPRNHQVMNMWISAWFVCCITLSSRLDLAFIWYTERALALCAGDFNFWYGISHKINEAYLSHWLCTCVCVRFNINLCPWATIL